MLWKSPPKPRQATARQKLRQVAWAIALAGALSVGGAAHARDTQQGQQSAPAQTAATSGGDYYTNVNGNRVHRPVRANSKPAGASARCSDGTYSFSENRRGTCSHHGGVATWY